MNKADKAIRQRRAAARKAELAVNHVGHLNRAQTFKDRRKEASRKACRGKGWE